MRETSKYDMRIGPFGVLFDDGKRDHPFIRMINLDVWQKRVSGLKKGQSFCKSPVHHFIFDDMFFNATPPMGT